MRSVEPEEYERDVAALQSAEHAAEVAAYDEAKSADDGTRVPMTDLLVEVGDVIDPKVTDGGGRGDRVVEY